MLLGMRSSSGGRKGGAGWARRIGRAGWMRRTGAGWRCSDVLIGNFSVDVTRIDGWATVWALSVRPGWDRSGIEEASEGCAGGVAPRQQQVQQLWCACEAGDANRNLVDSFTFLSQDWTRQGDYSDDSIDSQWTGITSFISMVYVHYSKIYAFIIVSKALWLRLNKGRAYILTRVPFCLTLNGIRTICPQFIMNASIV